MEFDKIYAILKEASLNNFYHPDRAEDAIFVYLDDARVMLRRVDQEDDRFGYDYFFDTNGKVFNHLDDYDKLVKQVCEVKDFPETYNNIEIETWAIQVNGVSVYWIELLKVSNLSSLRVYMPLTLKPYDYEVNLCDILNEAYRGSMSNIEQTIHNSLNINRSTFQDFLHR